MYVYMNASLYVCIYALLILVWMHVSICLCVEVSVCMYEWMVGCADSRDHLVESISGQNRKGLEKPSETFTAIPIRQAYIHTYIHITFSCYWLILSHISNKQKLWRVFQWNPRASQFAAASDHRTEARRIPQLLHPTRTWPNREALYRQQTHAPAGYWGLYMYCIHV